MRQVPGSGVARGRGSGRGAQRGAVLIVALIFVLVSALLGVSVMETSSVERRLVANEAYRQSVFRAAEAAADRALLAVDAGVLAGGDTPVEQPTENVDARISVEPADVWLEGIGHLLNNSTGLFQNRLYGVSVSASSNAVDARRTVMQGAARRAPATTR